MPLKLDPQEELKKICLQLNLKIDPNTLKLSAFTVPSIPLVRLVLGVPALMHTGVFLSPHRLETEILPLGIIATSQSYAGGLVGLKMKTGAHYSIPDLLTYFSERRVAFAEIFSAVGATISGLYEIINMHLLDASPLSTIKRIQKKIHHLYGVLGSFLYVDLIPSVKNTSLLKNIGPNLGQYYLRGSNS